MTPNLLESWAAWQQGPPPHLLEADRPVLMRAKTAKSLVVIGDWRSAYGGDDFARPGDRRLHLGLLPQPFCGDLSRASIYVLLLNPGIGNTDYYGEYEVHQYREALLRTLQQDFSQTAIPFFFLDPKYAWHGGFGWWHGKLAGVIGELAKRWDVSFAAARARLGRQIASLELLPYHSASFKDAGAWLKQLPSAALARAYVRDVIVPRVNDGKAIAIVMRQAAAWNLPPHARVIRYTGGQARGAHLSPASPGGRAIIDRLAP